ncbi:MAG: class I adenylate-forming enzyme family protein [Bacillota bacterium]
MIKSELVIDVIANGKEKYTDSEAVVFNETTLTYKQLENRVKRFSEALAGFGMKKGDRLALLLPTSANFLTCWLGASGLGVITVGLNVRYRESELSYMMDQSAPRLLVVSPEFAGTNMLEIIEKIRPKTVEQVIIDSDRKIDDYCTITEFTDRWAEKGQGAPPEPVYPEDGNFIIYTSGTTGKPKAALLNSRSILSMCRSLGKAMAVTPSDRLLNALPLNHVGGATILAINSLMHGSTLILQDSFHPEKYAQAIQEKKITVTGGVPTMLAMLLSSGLYKEFDLSSLRLVIFGGSPAPPVLLESLQKTLKCHLMSCYGLTEVSGFCTTTSLSDAADKIFSTVGKPLEGIDYKVVNQSGNQVNEGESGELLVRGDIVIPGYYLGPGNIDPCRDEDGWLHTGDIASVDKDGYISIVGRVKEMYITGGYNVYPPEIEDCLCQHPGVLLAAVIGVPDSIYGEVGKAFVLPRPGSELTTEILAAYCKERLADYKIPRTFEIVDSFPMTPLGKIRKSELKDMFVTK